MNARDLGKLTTSEIIGLSHTEELFVDEAGRNHIDLGADAHAR